MEENKQKESNSIKLSTVVLLLALIVIIIMGVVLFKFYNEKEEKVKEVQSLNEEVNNLQNTVDNLQEKIKSIQNTINGTTTEETNSSNETAEEKIVIDGGFAPTNGDGFWEFKSDGTVTRSGNVDADEGTYTTIGKNEIEVVYTKTTHVDDDGTKTTKEINETEKFKVIDNDTLEDNDGWRLTRWNQTNQ